MPNLKPMFSLYEVELRRQASLPDFTFFLRHTM